MHGGCAFAAKGGHLNIIKWLRSQNPPCPWDDFTFTCAVEFTSKQYNLEKQKNPNASVNFEMVTTIIINFKRHKNIVIWL